VQVELGGARNAHVISQQDTTDLPDVGERLAPQDRDRGGDQKTEQRPAKKRSRDNVGPSSPVG
jgi:hypothetical protein